MAEHWSTLIKYQNVLISHPKQVRTPRVSVLFAYTSFVVWPPNSGVGKCSLGNLRRRKYKRGDFMYTHLLRNQMKRRHGVVHVGTKASHTNRENTTSKWPLLSYVSVSAIFANLENKGKVFSCIRPLWLILKTNGYWLIFKIDP